jgi:glycosyltransferase involved in cell wall biosynthesis
MKVALVYDRVNKWGGAERVLLTLHELFPDAPLYTSVYNSKTAPWASVFNIKTSFLQQIPQATSHHEFLAPLMPLAFESFSFDKYDLVISLTSEAAKGIITKPHTRHLCYCLTPTRYLWSGHDDYFSDKTLHLLSRPAITYLRKWDKVAASRPDVFVAISQEVKKRIKKFYQRDSEVIYPALTLMSNHESEIRNQKNYKKKIKSKSFFLIVSRLSHFTKYKRIDLAVRACSALKLPLKVIGGGSWEKDLRNMAGPTVEFLGSLPDEKLVDYYQQCKALIFPGTEDFGLTIVEAQRFGRPVIAFRGGGAIETIVERKTGYFFDKQTVESLMEALRKFDNYSFDERACRMQAEKFGIKKFKKDFSSLVNKIL